MAFQTGSALNRNDLLDKLMSFMQSTGWNIFDYRLANDIGTYQSARIYASRNGMHVAIRNTFYGENVLGLGTNGRVNGIHIMLCTGFDLSVAMQLQPGSPCVVGSGKVYGNFSATEIRGAAIYDTTASDTTTPVYSYYFFDNGTDVAIAAELNAGSYQILCFGELQMLSNAMTAHKAYYVTGTSTSTFANYAAISPSRFSYYQRTFGRANNNAYAGYGGTIVLLNNDTYWMPPTSAATYNLGVPCFGGTGDSNGTAWYANSLMGNLVRPQIAPRGVHPLFPLVFQAGTSPLLGGPLGYVKDIRGTLFVDSMINGQEVKIGGDTWLLFDNRHGVPALSYGLAFKKVE